MMEAESADSLLSLSLQPGKSPVPSEGKDDTSTKVCCKSKKSKPVPCVCVPVSPPSAPPSITAVQALAALPASAVPVQAITVNSGMIRQSTPAPAAVVAPSPTSSCCPCPPARSSNKSAGQKRAARSVSPSLSDDDVDMDSSVSANGEEINKKRKRKASAGVVGGGDEAIMQRRKKHNEVEVRRRKRMNETFTQLRTLVDCKSTNKIAILSAAISKIQHFNDLQSRMGTAWPAGPVPALPVKKEGAKGSKNAVKLEKAADLPFVLPAKSHGTVVDKSSEKPLPALNPVAATPINPPHPALPNGVPSAAPVQQANPLAQSLPGGVPPSLLPFSWAALHNPAVYAALHGGLGLGMTPDYTNRMLSPGLTELLSSETFSKLGLLPGYPMPSGLGGLHSLLHNANAASTDPANPKPASDPLSALYAASASFQIPPPPSALSSSAVTASSAASTASEAVPAITVKSENSTTPNSSSSDRIVLSPAPTTQTQSAEASANVPLPDVTVKLSSSSCTLCFTNAIDTVLLPCGHMKYCSACIKSLGGALKGCAECKAPVSRMQALLPADPNSKLSLTSKCVLCDENPADVAFSPCGHFCYCASCTGRAKKCAKCMSSIDTRLHIQQ